MSNLFNCCKRDPEKMEKHPLGDTQRDPSYNPCEELERLKKNEVLNRIPPTCPISGLSGSVISNNCAENNQVHSNGNQEYVPKNDDTHSKGSSVTNSINNDQDKLAKKLRVNMKQPFKLFNYLDRSQTYDTLHNKDKQFSMIEGRCTDKICSGSVIHIPNRGNVPRTSNEVYEEAEKFLREYYVSIHRENSEAHMARLREVKSTLEQRHTYDLTYTELVFGTKLGWRNATRCIGRIQWKKLQVFDCREVTTAKGMFEALCTHIKYASNKGNIRSAITVFPQRTDGTHDYRIWNSQLLSYAGYKEPDGTFLGDPLRTEFTDICIKLGWKPPRTAWDILPLVLSADGKEPELFEIPREIVMETHMEHPKFKWFKDLGLRWYCVPAVANMSFDCGGLEFTATAFNGWYMSTEIACRNFCDINRRNISKTVALKMGLDTNSIINLWKDQALVEIHIAVLYSFHRDVVSIVDHHTASEQFMKHLENEMKSRGGCPTDWVWVVPPMSSSMTGVFHQEMALYYMRPSYDYQDDAWKTYKWPTSDDKPVTRKFHFRQIARAVKFTSQLFSRALSRRIKATILYATETGKSESYANELGSIFSHAFNAQVLPMDEYDMFSIEHETLLLIVTSTFGNGEAPSNGVAFGEHLFKMLNDEKDPDGHSSEASPGLRTPTPKSLMRTNSVITPTVPVCKKHLSRLESNKSTGASSIENFGPLSNLRFAVFGLGSSAYPKFCNFGKTIDRVLGELGGERIMDLSCGDEMLGQEQEFRTWSTKIFQEAGDTFCLEENMVTSGKNSISKLPLSEDTLRFHKSSQEMTSKAALEATYKKQLIACTVKKVKRLGDVTEDRETIFIDIQPNENIKYDPGDHLGVMACNRKEIVDAVLERLVEKDVDTPLQLQSMKETLSPLGSSKTWEKKERLPPVSIRELFTRYLDITTPPSTKILKYLAGACSDLDQAGKINELLTDSDKYDEWKHMFFPHLAEVLQQFPSCKPRASVLAALLLPLQPRFYSISSSPLAHPKSIHLTVAVVFFKTQGGIGPTHYGVCSNYLKNLNENEELFVFLRRAPSFHLPTDLTKPLILVGPGSGIAPLRGFWHHRKHQMKSLKPTQKPGQVWLFFGCRTHGMDIYKVEKEQAAREGVLSRVFLALSREKDQEQKYVQDHLEEEGEHVARMLMKEGGHFYVCGDCKMAEEVQQTLKKILQKHSGMTEQGAESFIMTLMDDNRYHEDIYGITLRTAEVQSASRASARRSRLESTKSGCECTCGCEESKNKK